MDKMLMTWDRSADDSIGRWLAAEVSYEKKLTNSIDTHKETSAQRDEIRQIVLSEILTLTDLENFYENYNICSDSYYFVGICSQYLIALSFHGKSVYLSVYSKSHDLSLELIKKLIDLFPDHALPNQDQVYFDFYMLGQDGRTSKTSRLLMTPSWPKVKKNYQKNTQKQLDDLMNLTPDSIGDGGKLILLHGLAGGGKSYAIRALMNQLKSWATPSYLMDPEKFFAIPPYMFDVILSNDHHYIDETKWRLIIAEDSDEFIKADAKERTGQGLSRLLNLADGILGQGLKVIFLLTTNEPLGALHPAVIRPGRCLANIEFKLFNKTESKTWLGDDFILPISKNEFSLAELYDLKRTQQQITDEQELITTGQYL